MSIITFSENHDGSLVPFEDGESLVSLSDPRGQALKWVYSLGSIPSDHVVVVGLGAGYHIEALADIYPQLNITVVDSRPSLASVFKSQFPDVANRVTLEFLDTADDLFKRDLFEDVQKNRSYVLSFRECWGQQGALFSELFAHLTGRSLESVRYHFQEFGFNIKALFLDPKKMISMKDLMPAIESASIPDTQKQMFRVLRELVK